MFKLFGGQSEDKKIHDQKILIDHFKERIMNAQMSLDFW
jgi:hypothetical protein